MPESAFLYSRWKCALYCDCYQFFTSQLQWPLLARRVTNGADGVLCAMQELADVIRDPGCALFQQVPDESGLYQPSEKAHVQADAVDVVSVFRSLGIVVAKAIISRACFPLRFTQCGSDSSHEEC